MVLKRPQRLALAQLPTPIQPLTRWSADLGGPQIWVKRDDLTGMDLSGNKIRKLEYVARAALDEQANVLITCGAVQSNHARATAVVATRLGLHAHLVLRGEEPAALAGNYFLDQMVGAACTFITPEAYRTRRQQIMEEIATAYAQQGRQAFIIPEGASDGLGAWGYAHAVEEIQQQAAQMGLHFDAMICAVGSGGTQAGLILGKALGGWETEIIGINICDDAAFFTSRILEILDEVRVKYLPQLEVGTANIHIIDGYAGDGYGKSRTEELETLVRLARCEGVILDPVYTGKAMHGLVQEIGRGRFSWMKNILFLHSGGLFGLLGVADSLRPLVTGSPA
ncbi:MAG TPA: D-cysteine desulfhydrase family protein [bacterium]|nr:D-cysteine desulfhydrase family protein [bacterium]HPR88372.1 D-cysteine desulfhydrase family protein [bacterium]